jgi:hypothetical protein
MEGDNRSFCHEQYVRFQVGISSRRKTLFLSKVYLPIFY